jgi:hypothetical protein
MPGLDPGIHMAPLKPLLQIDVLLIRVDGRDKPGHDESI